MARLEKIRDIIIYKDKHYNTFPNVVKKADGTLLLAFRQAPDWRNIMKSWPNSSFGKVTHVDPSSKAVYITSGDNGLTWDKEASDLYDDYAYGVQDPCLNMLKDGIIFCTFFMWKVFNLKDYKGDAPKEYIVNGNFIREFDNVYTVRSFDGGRTWDEIIPVEYEGKIAGGLRGNASELSDGSIIMSNYGARAQGEPSVCAILKTTDRGRTWVKISEIASDGDFDFHEPNIFKTRSGKLVAFIRAHKRDDKSVYLPGRNQSSPLFTSESRDGGYTWSKPCAHAFYSPSPFHALQLQSGNVLISYGHRYQPYGIRAFLLDPECSSFDSAQEIVLRDDGTAVDLGYTSAVQTDDGNILVTYYFHDGEEGARYIAGSICKEV